MSEYLDRLSKIGARATNLYLITLIVVAAISCVLALTIPYVVHITSDAGVANFSSLALIYLIVAVSVISSLVMGVVSSILLLLATRRLLVVFTALVLREIHPKVAVETVQTTTETQVQELISAQQPTRPLSLKPTETKAVKIPQTEKKCPQCGRTLPYGNVHIVCPYCGRRLR